MGKVTMMMDAERCVCCGEIIPEGRQVCLQCEKGKGSMAELKLCPFCRKKPLHYYFTDGFNTYSRVSCKECGVSLTKKQIIGTEAIEAWNRRCEDAPTVDAYSEEQVANIIQQTEKLEAKNKELEKEVSWLKSCINCKIRKECPRHCGKVVHDCDHWEYGDSTVDAPDHEEVKKPNLKNGEYLRSLSNEQLAEIIYKLWKVYAERGEDFSKNWCDGRNKKNGKEC